MKKNNQITVVTIAEGETKSRLTEDRGEGCFQVPPSEARLADGKAERFTLLGIK